MLLGLISDTHGTLRPEVFQHFRDVDLILHAGDVGDPHIITELESLAPVHAVWGNVDGFEVRHATEEEFRLELEGRAVVVVHGHRLGSPDAEKLRSVYPEADVIVYGHTHRPRVDRDATGLVVNPGAAGPARFDIGPSVARLRLTAQGMEVEHIDL